MRNDTIIASSLSRLQKLLVHEFGATEGDFTGQVRAATPQLPEDLAQALSALQGLRESVSGPPEATPEQAADFAFRCGQVHAKLEAYRQVQMELENVVVGPESVSATPLQSSQIEPLARFVEIRNEIFRKVADFTLKALLIGLGLLLLGLALGLV